MLFAPGVSRPADGSLRRQQVRAGRYSSQTGRENATILIPAILYAGRYGPPVTALPRALRLLSIALGLVGALLVYIGDGPVRCDGDNCGAATWRPYGLVLLVLAGLTALLYLRMKRSAIAPTPDR